SRRTLPASARTAGVSVLRTRPLRCRTSTFTELSPSSRSSTSRIDSVWPVPTLYASPVRPCSIRRIYAWTVSRTSVRSRRGLRLPAQLDGGELLGEVGHRKLGRLPRADVVERPGPHHVEARGPRHLIAEQVGRRLARRVRRRRPRQAALVVGLLGRLGVAVDQ